MRHLDMEKGMHKMAFENICIGAGPQDALAFSILGQQWLGFVALAAAASYIGLALVYMLSSFLRNAALEAWVKGEIFQVTAVVVLMAIMGFIVYGMCNFDVGFLSERYRIGPEPATPYKVATDYLLGLRNGGRELYFISLTSYSIIARVSEPLFNSIPLGIGVSMQPLAGLAALKTVLSLLSKGWLVAYIVVVTQVAVIDYLKRAMFGFLLPLGAVMMALTPTRQFGGAMVALALGMFFVLPILLVFNDLLLGPLPTAPPGSEGLIGEQIKESLEGFSGYSGEADPYSEFSEQLTEEKRQKNIDGSVGLTLHFARLVALYALAAVVLTAINFTVLVQVVREFSNMLGAEVDVTNLTRFI